VSSHICFGADLALRLSSPLSFLFFFFCRTGRATANVKLRYGTDDEGGVLLIRGIMNGYLNDALMSNPNVVGFLHRAILKGIDFPRPCPEELIEKIKAWEVDKTPLGEEVMRRRLGLPDAEDLKLMAEVDAKEAQEKEEEEDAKARLRRERPAGAGLGSGWSESMAGAKQERGRKKAKEWGEEEEEDGLGSWDAGDGGWPDATDDETWAALGASPWPELSTPQQSRKEPRQDAPPRAREQRAAAGPSLRPAGNESGRLDSWDSSDASSDLTGSGGGGGLGDVWGGGIAGQEEDWLATGGGLPQFSPEEDELDRVLRNLMGPSVMDQASTAAPKDDMGWGLGPSGSGPQGWQAPLVQQSDGDGDGNGRYWNDLGRRGGERRGFAERERSWGDKEFDGPRRGFSAGGDGEERRPRRDGGRGRGRGPDEGGRGPGEGVGREERLERPAPPVEDMSWWDEA
jgi:hypothetical protein